MMAARARFDTDAPYITHPRSAALYYTPLPAETMHQLANIRALMRHAPNETEFRWLAEQEGTLRAELDALIAPPVPVRHNQPPRRDRKPKATYAYLDWAAGVVRGRR